MEQEEQPTRLELLKICIQTMQISIKNRVLTKHITEEETYQLAETVLKIKDFIISTKSIMENQQVSILKTQKLFISADQISMLMVKFIIASNLILKVTLLLNQLINLQLALQLIRFKQRRIDQILNQNKLMAYINLRNLNKGLYSLTILAQTITSLTHSKTQNRTKLPHPFFKLTAIAKT